MRNHGLGRLMTMGALALLLSMPTSEAQAPAGGAQGARGARGARGGGQPAAPSKPTPHWPDGRVNLSQAPGIKGWFSREKLPIALRTNLKVGKPTAAVILRTCRFFPSVSVMHSQLVAISSLCLIGGVRAHSHSGA